MKPSQALELRGWSVCALVVAGLLIDAGFAGKLAWAVVYGVLLLGIFVVQFRSPELRILGPSAVVLGSWVPALMMAGVTVVALEFARVCAGSPSAGLWAWLALALGVMGLIFWLLVCAGGMIISDVRKPWILGGALLIPSVVWLIRDARLQNFVVAVDPVVDRVVLGLVAFAGGILATPRMRTVFERDQEEQREAQRRAQVREEGRADDAKGNASSAAQLAEAEARVAAQMKGVGMALSGGGHRATLFGLGVMLYLARARQNARISQIASVSGGSLTSGFIAQTINFQTATAAEFDRVVGKLAAQIADRGTLFAPWQAKAYLGALVVTGALAAAALVALFLQPAAIPPTWLTWVAPLGFAALFGRVLQLRGRLCAYAFEQTLFRPGGKPTTLADLSSPPFHIICATELQTGNGAYFLREPFKVTYDTGVALEFYPCVKCSGFQTTIRAFPLATAVQSSAALPFAFPTVTLDVQGWRGITRRKRHQAWAGSSASHMLLVDGGVRDNLGVEWFESNPHVDQIIVVSGAANRIHAKPRSTRIPILGELLSLLLVKDLPYNTREQNRRNDLLRRFLPSYAGAATDLTGVIVHIDDSPYDLPEALMRSTPNAPFDSWLNTAEDLQVAKALRQNPAFNAFETRAQSARQKLEQSEDIEQLRAAKRDQAKKNNASSISLALIERTSAAVLVAETWDQRAFANANVSTNLSRLGRRTAAELIRHSYALAMTKLHILFDYPLCDIPSLEELYGLMDQAEK